MTWRPHDYENIPGTYVFDGRRSNSAYRLNKLLYSFISAENRQAFADDPEGYADRFGLSSEQQHAIVTGDFLGMLRMGANVYYMAKMAIPAGVSVQDVGAAFHGIDTDEFKAILLKNAEGFQDKLDKVGGFWNG